MTNLCKITRKMITVFVHKVISITPEFFSHFFHNSFYIMFSKICISYEDRLPAIVNKF